MHRLFFAIASIASISLAACGGGGGSTNQLPNASPQGSARHLVVAFSGTTTLSKTRRTLDTATKVTVTLNNSVVGDGRLDASGKVAIEIDRSIPSGSTLMITAGSVTASIVWNQTNEDAAVLVQVNADGTLNVSVASGDQPTTNPAAGDPNESQETEERDGSPTSVDDGDGNAALPANLPIAVTSTCSAITVTPESSKITSMRFEENVQDGEDGSKLKFEGPFTAAMTFPLVAQSARIRIRLFDADNNQLLDVKAPVGAFTAQPGQATPAPCPTVTP